MPLRNVFRSGPFAGIPVTDAFAEAAQRESPIIYRLPAVPWPSGLRPQNTQLGSYAPGTKITAALSANADVLVVLYTDQETQALLDVLTGDASWSTSVQNAWCPYAHNYGQIKRLIANPKANNTLSSGAFGRLRSLKIAGREVVLYKSDLHPKQDGTGLPFVKVIGQLIAELKPSVVITTGTAGAIGSRLRCGDVTVCADSRLHLQKTYPRYPTLNSLAASNSLLSSPGALAFDLQHVQYAATHFTELSLPGLQQCYERLQAIPGYAFVKMNAVPPSIYVGSHNPVPGPEPMATVSADYMTTDDANNAEGLQPLGIMNDTDDAFVFFAISQLPSAKRPRCLSVRNASEPQIQHAPFPSTATQGTIMDTLKGVAGAIYGIYQYCTTLNSAFACWGIIAGL
jgi:hypothetical protein